MPSKSQISAPVDLVDAVRRSWLVLVVGGLCGLLLGVAGASRIELPAVATTPILVNPLEGNAFYPSSRGEQLVNLGTEAQALQSDRVAERVSERLEGELDPSALLGGVSVDVPVNTQILEVGFTHEDPAVARRASQAFAEEYLEFRRDRSQSKIDSQTQQLDEQIQQRRVELEQLTAELATLPLQSPEVSINQQRQDAAAAQISTLTARRAELASVPLDPGDVVTPAAIERTGPFTLPRLLPVAGLVAGLGGAVLLMLLRFRFDRRLHSPQDVREIGVPVLGAIGCSTDDDRDAATFRAEDEFRRLRVAVLAQVRRRPFTLLYAPAGESDGRTAGVVAIDLASTFARAGVSTTLLDATSETSGPSSHVAGLGDVGLSDVLLGVDVVSRARSTPAPRLSVVTPGGDIDRVVDLFQSREMERVLADLLDGSDVIVVAADSFQSGAAQSLAQVVDAVALQVDEAITTQQELTEAAAVLELFRPDFIGTVFVGHQGHLWPTELNRLTTLTQRQLPPVPAQLQRGPDLIGMPPRPMPSAVGDEHPETDEDRGEPGTDDGQESDADPDEHQVTAFDPSWRE